VVDETGDETLDFVLRAGPRAITPDTPEHVIKEVAKSKSFGSLRQAMLRMKIENRRRVEAAILRTCRENRILEQQYKGTSTMLPDARIPLDLVFELEAQEHESWNPEMRADTLRCYPGLKLSMKRQ
jgi:hypothetical protein